MNRIFMLLAALPLFINAQNGMQEDMRNNTMSKGDFEIGVGGGVALSTFHGSDADGYKARSSSQVGVTAEYYLSDRWSLKSGFIFDSKGGVLENASDEITEVQLDYLFVPMYANWHFGAKRNWYFNVGPYLAILLDAEAQGSELVDIDDEVESFDFGLGLGLGRKFKISNNASIFFEYQGALGFLEVRDTQSDDNVSNFRSALNAGVIFSL